MPQISISPNTAYTFRFVYVENDKSCQIAKMRTDGWELDSWEVALSEINTPCVVLGFKKRQECLVTDVSLLRKCLTDLKGICERNLKGLPFYDSGSANSRFAYQGNIEAYKIAIQLLDDSANGLIVEDPPCE